MALAFGGLQPGSEHIPRSRGERVIVRAVALSVNQVADDRAKVDQSAKCNSRYAMISSNLPSQVDGRLARIGQQRQPPVSAVSCFDLSGRMLHLKSPAIGRAPPE